MTELASLVEQLRSYSQLLDRESSTFQDFEEELVSVASEFRAMDVSYHFEYQRPEQAPFKLRSKEMPGSDALEDTIEFLEPGRWLRVAVEGVPEDVFEGVLAELTVLGEAVDIDADVAREPELNLLTDRVFQAELYAEFQRWERYDSPMYLLVVHLDEDTDWTSAAREIKHAGKQRDLAGYIDSTTITGLFSGREPDADFEEMLNERLNVRYDGTIEWTLVHVPKDVTNWNELQNLISTTDSQEERDRVGNRRS